MDEPLVIDGSEAQPSASAKAPADKPDAPRARGASQRILIITLVILATVGLVWERVTRDARAIRGNLSKLKGLVEKTKPEGPLTGMARTQEISRFFSVDVHVILGDPFPVLSDRDELSAIMYEGRTSAQSIRITIRDTKLTLEKDRRTATMDITAEAQVAIHGRQERDVREFRLSWKREETGWRIAKIELTSSIQRPPGLQGPML